MGAVVSCVQSIFRTIGNVLMAIVNGIGSILHAIISGIVSFFDILISFLTCGYCSKRKRAGRRTKHTTTTSRI
ncbi:hypothetical protein F5Y15DRAFT_84957 [Xylariaceae sp. FL0016]|nr:hypothetical protein F5Y15DRAFT_84957 [Xylariaceae sp. FL0016]